MPFSNFIKRNFTKIYNNVPLLSGHINSWRHHTLSSQYMWGVKWSPSSFLMYSTVQTWFWFRSLRNQRFKLAYYLSQITRLYAL